MFKVESIYIFFTQNGCEEQNCDKKNQNRVATLSSSVNALKKSILGKL